MGVALSPQSRALWLPFSPFSSRGGWEPRTLSRAEHGGVMTSETIASGLIWEGALLGAVLRP